MNVWQRQIFAGVLTCFGFSIVLLLFTFMAFPIPSLSILWTRRVMDLPYGLLILTFSITAGLVVGLAEGFIWRRRLDLIEHQLDELSKGNGVVYENGGLPEVHRIEQRMKQIEQKFNEQAELAQKAATERAEEREKSLQEVVVQERNRLARELHDSVSQQLFASSMMMSAITESTEGSTESHQQLKMVERMIHQSQLEMRALLLHLRPVALKDKRLAEGIEELLVELKQKVPMDIEWNVEDLELDKGVEDQLFRILQESVSNTLRHAKADKLQVTLILRDYHIILRVVDDGKGFKVEEEKSSSYGLRNMKERAMEIGGVCKVVSLLNQGTRLEVKVPYRKKGGVQS